MYWIYFLGLLTWTRVVNLLPVPNETEEDYYYVCDSPVCQQRAQQIKESLDQRVDPCKNFYAYACGGWRKKHKIPEEKSSYGSFNILYDELQETLRGILGNMTLVYDYNQNTTDKVALAYNACMAVPEAGDQYKVMWQIMNDSGLAHWPLLPEKGQRPVKELNWTKILLDVGMTPILQLSVDRDSKYITNYIIQLDQISFGSVGRNQLIHPKTKHNKPIIDAYKKLISAAAKFMNPNITKSEAKRLADDLVAFEGKLANFTAPPEERRDIMAIHHRTTIGALQKKFSEFPLLDLLNVEFNKINIRLNKTEHLEIYALDYYRKMTPFLRKTTPERLYNYFGMRTVLFWAAQASEAIRNASFELEKVVSGVKKDRPRWKKCVGLVNSAMQEVTGYLYVMKNFREEAKKEVEDMVTAIKDAFNATLRHSSWMDTDTRCEAKIKLEEMRRKIAYPDWLLNSTSLDQFCKYIPRLNISSPFLSMWRSIRVNNWKTMLDKLRKTYDPDKTWIVGPAVVNAFYNPSGNEMVYPAGILQGVFYQYGLPRSINIGAIGSVIGHELTHGFDDQGSQYDAEGRLREWWSNSTRQKFRKKSQCFVKQYGNIYDKEAKMKLNGKNTLGENIADNGGLRTAFRAYKNILKTECGGIDTRLQGLEKLSGEKLFFIANAMVWCDLVRPEEKKFIIQYDPHSPSKYRINIPMSNMAEFSKVFKCPARSRMHPDRKKTCALW